MKKRFYLTNYRVQKSLTQRQVAEAMDVAVSSYNRIENGYRGEFMNAEKLVRLADYLGVDIRQLCFDEIAYQAKKRKNFNTM